MLTMFLHSLDIYSHFTLVFGRQTLFRICSVGPCDLPELIVSSSRTLNQMMRGSQRADWIGRSGIAGEQECLAPATSEIFSSTFAAPTRFRHPLFSAKALEGSGLAPYTFQWMFADVIKSHARNHPCSVARKHLPRGINQQEPLAPSPHARLGVARIIIRNHTINSHAARKPLLRSLHNSHAVIQLSARRKQRIPILQPDVNRSVRDFSIEEAGETRSRSGKEAPTTGIRFGLVAITPARKPPPRCRGTASAAPPRGPVAIDLSPEPESPIDHGSG